MAQLYRICLLMQETRVPSLIREDPTRAGQVSPAPHLLSLCSGAWGLQLPSSRAQLRELTYPAPVLHREKPAPPPSKPWETSPYKINKQFFKINAQDPELPKQFEQNGKMHTSLDRRILTKGTVIMTIRR